MIGWCRYGDGLGRCVRVGVKMKSLAFVNRDSSLDLAYSRLSSVLGALFHERRIPTTWTESTLE